MSKQGSRNLLGVISFVVMIVCAAMFLVTKICGACGLNTNNSVFGAIDLVAKCCMYFVIAVVAYWYVSDQKAVWKIIYWVIVVCFIVFVVLGIKGL